MIPFDLMHCLAKPIRCNGSRSSALLRKLRFKAKFNGGGNGEPISQLRKR
jgi:hypothetical protein